MENITQLIRNLNRKEVSYVRKFFNQSKNQELLMRSRLFEEIRNGKNITKTEFEKIFNKSTTSDAFRMLHKRLQDDILKILVLYAGPERFSSKFWEAKHRCRCIILEIDLLMRMGQSNLAMERLKKAERLAKKYELTIDKIAIDEHKQTIIGLRKGISVYNKTIQDNIKDIESMQLKFKAKDYFRKLIYPNLFSVNKELNYLNEAYEATKQLKSITEINDSGNIRYFYLRSEIFYNHLIGNYEVAKKYAFEFLELIQTNRAVNSYDNMGGAYMIVSQIFIYLGDGEKAVSYASEGMQYFVRDSLNQISLCENLFLGLIVARDYLAAGEVILKVNNLKNFKTNQFRQAKWIYYKANLLFLQGKYEESLSILQKQSELLADKSGWRLGYKTLEMMCIVELGNYDWLDYRIETFRKLLSSVKKENIYRAKSVMQVIKNFIRSGYDFKQANIKSKEHLELLSKAEDNFRYDPKGYEVIRFDEWWISKVKSKTKVQAS